MHYYDTCMLLDIMTEDSLDLITVPGRGLSLKRICIAQQDTHKYSLCMMQTAEMPRVAGSLAGIKAHCMRCKRMQRSREDLRSAG